MGGRRGRDPGRRGRDPGRRNDPEPRRLRLDVLRVAAIPGRRGGRSGPNRRAPASRAPLKHCALVEGIAVHVARPRAIASSLGDTRTTRT